jgi:hypothetical protein
MFFFSGVLGTLAIVSASSAAEGDAAVVRLATSDISGNAIIGAFKTTFRYVNNAVALGKRIFSRVSRGSSFDMAHPNSLEFCT